MEKYSHYVELILIVSKFYFTMWPLHSGGLLYLTLGHKKFVSNF